MGKPAHGDQRETIAMIEEGIKVGFCCAVLCWVGEVWAGRARETKVEAAPAGRSAGRRASAG